MSKYIRTLIGYLSSILLLCVATAYASQTGQPLPADQAFVFQARIADKKNLELYWQIAPGFHIYQDQLQVLNSKNKDLLTKQNLPKGTDVHDPILGTSIEYNDSLLITLPLNDSITDELLVHYQGCSVDGFCYEPIAQLLNMNGLEQPKISATELQEFPESDEEDDANEVSTLAYGIKNAFLPLTLLIFFGFGFLLSFSPCVLPMIPLVVNLIVGTEKMSARKSALLASLYVLGMACSYAIAGTLVGMLGAKLQAWIQQPAILITFSTVLILLALSQLEIITIKIPSFNRRLHHWGQRQLQGSLAGAFILGIISSLIVSPCITPPLIGVLTYIGQNGNPFIGGLTLFFLGLGMGVPLIIVAMLSSVILPKAGRWMNLIKIGTAVALLGLAIWILQRILDPAFTLILWAGLCIIFAWYLRKGDKLLKLLAILLAILALVFLSIAIVQNYQQMHPQPLSKQKVAEINTWYTIHNTSELQQYLSTAQSKNMYTMVEVYATWCTSCRRIELGVFTNPAVQEKLKTLMLLRVDVSNVTPEENELLNSLQVYGPPALLFFGKDGKEIETKRLIGAVSVKQLLDTMQF